MNDWLEKELEDYIVANPYELAAQVFLYFEEQATVLGRQIRCQFGIIDVLMWVHSEYVSKVLVVECKAKHEKGLAVEQVERYRDAIFNADIYSNLPHDAWPELGTDYHGWAGFIQIDTIPVLVAPSFDDKLVATYNGTLISAEKHGDKFKLLRVGGRPLPDKQGQLDDVLAPVIKRAQVDAKARAFRESFKHIQLGDTFRRN